MGFEERAQGWLAWARTPGHDAYYDMPVAVSEAARVLAPGGRLCACITQPVQTASAWDQEDEDAPLVVSEAYLDRRWMDAAVERDGLKLTFDGWCYPLEAYTRALEAAGLLIEAIREPADPAGGRWARVPMFLMWRALKARQGADRPGLAMRTCT
jgi:hypothetical protein